MGFGTWQAAPGEVERALVLHSYSALGRGLTLRVEEALKVGYRHLDCALIYGNQNEVSLWDIAGHPLMPV